jgi:hypothetical protein
VTLPSGDYWLIDELNPDVGSIKLHSVKEDSYKETREQASYLVVGRGRHADLGEVVGVEGSLVGQIRDDLTRTARSKKQALEAFRKESKPAYLRNPFGDIWKVTIGDIQVSRIAGVGASEFVDVTIPYEQVF